MTKFLKTNYKKDWNTISDELKEIYEEKDYQGKHKINKIKLAVLIELMMRQNNNLIKGDIFWLFKY